MSTTSVRFLQSAVVTSGLLQIDNIAAGVGVILFNPEHKTAAGVHIMAASAGPAQPKNPLMYADTAIPHLLEQLRTAGTSPPFSVAVAGGSGMMGNGNGTDVGGKVVAAVHEALHKAGLKAKVEKTGGTRVRSMVLDVDAGKIKVS